MKLVKSIALIGAAAFVLSFASCASSKSEAAPAETPAAEEAAPAEEEVAEEAAAEEEAPVEEAAVEEVVEE